MGKNDKSSAKSARKGPNAAQPKRGGAAAKGAGGRRTGLRGAAPWAARHAAKHAAEARARNASPAPPGSARATLRVPEKAEQIKASVASLHNTLVRIRALRKNLTDKFFEMGVLLGEIKDARLFEAKGYSSFEVFVEREIDLGKTTSLRLERIPRLFHEQPARQLGLDALFAALEAIENVTAAQRPGPSGQRAQQPAVLPLKPPGGKR